VDDRWPGPTPDELEALDALDGKGSWVLQGRELKLTNLDKVLFPGRPGEAPLTKRDLIRHHAQVGPALLPYLEGRALNANRFPQGVDRPGFFHKAAPSHLPDWIGRWTYPGARDGETRTYVVPDSVPALAWLANYGAVELNPWTSRTGSWQHPTWAYIDLDPGRDTSWADIVLLARLHKVALDALEVEAAAKVTGKRGIQIWVPVADGTTFDRTRTWVEAVGHHVGKVVPDMVSWSWSKADRGGKARLDYTQNARNKTLVAPFSARPAPGAPVSVPIGWDELNDPDLAPDRWTIRTVGDRLAERGDPLLPLVGLQQDLPDI
jgi:bifunctional non-homologous end joining protein LigD